MHDMKEFEIQIVSGTPVKTFDGKMEFLTTYF